MRISTYMALGRTMIKPLAGVHLHPYLGAYMEGLDKATDGCAWGMVNVAAGNEKWNEINLFTRRLIVALPCGCMGLIVGGGMQKFESNGRESLSGAVVHLFNHHVMTIKDWTMDQLIDWLRSVEPADPEEDSNATSKTAAREETAERVGAVPVLR